MKAVDMVGQDDEDYTPEQLRAAAERLADMGRLKHLVPGLREEIIRPFAEAGVDLGDERAVNAILAACRWIAGAAEQLVGDDAKELAALLTRRVAARIVAELCDTLMVNVVRANHTVTHPVG